MGKEKDLEFDYLQINNFIKDNGKMITLKETEFCLLIVD